MGEGRGWGGERGGRFCPDVQVPLPHTPPAAAALTWVWGTGEWQGQVCPGTVESVFLLSVPQQQGPHEAGPLLRSLEARLPWNLSLGSKAWQPRVAEQQGTG